MPHASSPSASSPSAPGLRRRAMRLGLIAVAGLSAVGASAGAATAAPGPAHASPGSPFTGNQPVVRGVGIASDSAFTLANRAHTSRFQDSFTVHQYGYLYTAGVRNQATAESVACAPNAPCRSVALSFQIVTMAGTGVHLNASNTSSAQNVHCDGCQTLAGAYQFVVDTPTPIQLTAADQSHLASIHRQLDALGSSHADIATVKAQADALAAQVTALLQAAATRAPASPTTTLTHPAPHVTVHRTFTA